MKRETIEHLRKLRAAANLDNKIQTDGQGFWWVLRDDGFNQFWGNANHQPYNNERAAQFVALIAGLLNALPELFDE